MRILWSIYVWSVSRPPKSHHRIGTESILCLGYLTQNYSELLRLCSFQRQYFSAIPEMPETKVDAELHSPNPEVRGMTVLNRSAFKRTITVPALTVKKDIIHRLMKSLKNKVLHRPGLKRVVDDLKDEDKKLVLLDPCKISCQESLEKDELLLLEEMGITPQIIKYDLELSYENFKTEEILRAVLPEGQDVTSGFSRIGHIAHMNLREHQLPYKNLIGQVIMDKNPGVTSVVNKTNTIDTTYRNFQMEILAGDNNMITKVRENNTSYEFDFSKVYWNPRLSTEHERIIGLLKSGDILFDVFAGVGPFAIPAAKKNCTVFANDLNPESYKWLLHNCKLNKVDKKVQTFNMDGRDFISLTVKEQLTQQLALPPEERKNSVHVVMNLPGLAVEFLDAFQGLLEEQPSRNVTLPTVHCYSFSKDDNPAGDIRRRAETFVGASIEECSSIHLVRNVAPNKEMMCISFRIPDVVLYKKVATLAADEPSSKRIRIDEESTEKRSN
ncbi:tRNA (guanine(37)-N1)-methyltransferase isoform X2 [Pleurodeles waltl]|uniref:tRNA (guanine(37)-N1)-methyltransferase isoform X2 n=1 Tax=Pleurodeles waltl TaxID=8319 RepID=UPI003709ADF1